MTTPMHRLRSAAGIAVIDNYIYGACLLSVLIYSKRYITAVNIVVGGCLYLNTVFNTISFIALKD